MVCLPVRAASCRMIMAGWDIGRREVCTAARRSSYGGGEHYFRHHHPPHAKPSQVR